MKLLQQLSVLQSERTNMRTTDKILLMSIAFEMRLPWLGIGNYELRIVTDS